MVMYNGHITRDAVAAASREVLGAWQQGDAVAARVVADGLDALARRVRSVTGRLRLVEPLVCMSGGVFKAEAYARAFTAAVHALLPAARVERARLGPAAGAVLLALRAGGIPVTDALRSTLLTSASEDRP
jgi:N-acetylglucosamine kinase-like BadF-type ATPase